MAERYLMTPLTRIVLALTLLFSSTLSATGQDEEPLDRTIICCVDRRCHELRHFNRRRTKDGIEVMTSEAWCSIGLDYYTIRIFSGIPSNACELLHCFSDNKKK